ncbi:polysaccharide pyruvyl transferase family protein [Sphingobacterium sp.]|uniref:polysaccharide pyruvyl transferase family protein n=1 Tax=Sphingobacterium sp. TaxID=341027 RepID=UPI002899BEC4|nr:polysaccharide pyruvyl transferase family protein [Sphingobacterium sp.]
MIQSDIFFTGYYGQLNTGDDAFVEVASWGANKFWNKKNLRFSAVSQRLPRVKTSIKGYPFSIPKTYNFQQSLLLNNTDYLISAGGSTFQNKIKSGSLKAKAMLLQEKNKLKIGAIGVSVGPFKSKAEENDNIEYLKRMSFLAVRDQRSYDYVKTLDLPYEPIEAFDLAALLPQIYGIPDRILQDRKVIGVSLCNYERYINGDTANETRRNKEISQLLKALDDRFENVIFKFFIINGNSERGDLELTRETIQNVAFKNEVQIENYDTKTIAVWNSIASCDFVLTTRLHAGIFACFANTPFMMVEYHKKCTDFLNDVGQHNIYRMNDACFDHDLILQSIENIFENGQMAPKHKDMMILKAELNFKNVIL